MAVWVEEEKADRAIDRAVTPERSVKTTTVTPLQMRALNTPAAILNLQRLAGNRAVVQRLEEDEKLKRQDALRNLHQQDPRFKKQGAMSNVHKHDAVDGSRLPTRGGFALEATKPTAVIGGGMGAGLGSGDMGIGSGIIGAASLLDAGLTAYEGSERYDKAKAKGDTAGMSIGRGKMRTGAWGASSSTASTSAAGVDIGKAVSQHGTAALGTAAGAFGVIGGSITTLQGLWRMYKAAGKLSTLADRTMYTDPGNRWKDRVVNREKWKLGVGALKVAVGALGIAAGALLITSNPLGWAIGIAAAVAGGAWALTKIGNKLKGLWERRQAKKKVHEQDPDGRKQKSAKELADQVARECSTNAKTAGEMITALGAGDATVVPRRLEQDRQAQFLGRRQYTQEVNLLKPTGEDKKAYDAFSLLGVLNIAPEEAQSDSGQERIEKKLSVAESG